MFSKLAFAAAVAALFTTTSGHMVMTSPNPFAPDTLNNSPLDASGSDYPCKQRPNVYGPAKGDNQMPVGAQQTLSFKGSAVHGGGSCQVSLTTDKNPTKNSNFKVVHSIIGGCPSNATAGNLPENQNGDAANKYFFSIPNDVPNGDYALAWTWFNKIGNREMYMNCAPVTVTGSTGSKDTFNALPNMFIANVGPSTCKVPDSKNVVFPNPGKSVETDAPDSQAPPQCPAGDNDGSAPPGGQAQPAAPQAGPPPAGAGPASSAAPQGPAASGGASSSAGAAATPAPQGGSTPAAASPVAAAPAAPATPGVAPPAGSVPCTNPGQVVCIGTSQFGICDITMAAVPQPLAQGTHCSNGQIMRKRSPLSGSLMARHAHGNAHAHQH